MEVIATIKIKLCFPSFFFFPSNKRITALIKYKSKPMYIIGMCEGINTATGQGSWIFIYQQKFRWTRTSEQLTYLPTGNMPLTIRRWKRKLQPLQLSFSTLNALRANRWPYRYWLSSCRKSYSNRLLYQW